MKTSKKVLRKSTEYRIHLSTLVRIACCTAVLVALLIIGYKWEKEILYWVTLFILLVFGAPSFWLLVDSGRQLLTLMRHREAYYFYITEAHIDKNSLIRPYHQRRGKHHRKNTVYYAIIHTTEKKRVRFTVPERIAKEHIFNEAFIVGYNSVTHQVLTFREKDEPNLAEVNRREDPQQREICGKSIGN